MKLLVWLGLVGPPACFGVWAGYTFGPVGILIGAVFGVIYGIFYAEFFGDYLFD